MPFQSAPPRRHLRSSWPSTVNWGRVIGPADHAALLRMLRANPDRLLRVMKAHGLGLHDVRTLLVRAGRLDPDIQREFQARARQMGMP